MDLIARWNLKTDFWLILIPNLINNFLAFHYLRASVKLTPLSGHVGDVPYAYYCFFAVFSQNPCSTRTSNKAQGTIDECVCTYT